MNSAILILLTTILAGAYSNVIRREVIEFKYSLVSPNDDHQTFGNGDGDVCKNLPASDDNVYTAHSITKGSCITLCPERNCMGNCMEFSSASTTNQQLLQFGRIKSSRRCPVRTETPGAV